MGIVEPLREERREQYQGHMTDDATTINDANERRQIDLPMAIDILAQSGYANRNEEDEMKMYFRILDHGNKGCITLEDLQRAQTEAKEAERELSIGREGSGGGMGVGVVGDATLQAMIDQFDQNRDGVIDYEEFKRIMEPVI